MSAAEPVGFAALIAAFTIFRKYDNPRWPTFCDHDTLYIAVAYSKVSDEDKARLETLGFEHAHEREGVAQVIVGQQDFATLEVGYGRDGSRFS